MGFSCSLVGWCTEFLNITGTRTCVRAKFCWLILRDSPKGPKWICQGRPNDCKNKGAPANEMACLKKILRATWDFPKDTVYWQRVLQSRHSPRLVFKSSLYLCLGDILLFSESLPQRVFSDLGQHGWNTLMQPQTSNRLRIGRTWASPFRLCLNWIKGTIWKRQTIRGRYQSIFWLGKSKI